MDLVLRCLVLFPLVVVLIRIVNRRQLSSLEPFDLVLLVVIGDLLQQGITQNDFSVTGSAIVITTITLLSLGTAYLNWRLPILRLTLEGEPIILLEDGRPIERNLRRQRITTAELAAQARQNNIATLDAVRYAVLAGALARTTSVRERLAESLSRRLNAPTDCRELARLVARLAAQVERATELTPAALLDLLLSIDALRRPERLDGLLRVCAAWGHVEGGAARRDGLAAARLAEALRIVRGVRLAPHAPDQPRGTDIVQRVRAARLKALREWMKTASI